MPYSKTLLKSSIDKHSEHDHFLCLVDHLLPQTSFYPEGCVVVQAEELDIPDFQSFTFRYDIMELNTAVKPFMFLYLFARGYDHVIYFDPDIKLYRPVDGVLAALEDGADAVFTPHVTRPAENSRAPDDLAFMRTGAFNLGFAAFRGSDEVTSVLRWWGRRLRYQCLDEQHDGIFVDQKFMDLVPGFLPRVAILRDTSLNVAYWNLSQRALDSNDEGWTIDDADLTFFHFSGFDPRTSTRLSKHTELFSQYLPAALQSLLEDYRLDLVENGLNHTPRAGYAYERFASGAMIPIAARRMFRESFMTWEGDPFRNFEHYMQQKAVGTASGHAGIVCTNLMRYLWGTSAELQRTCDLRDPEGVRRLFDWFVRHSHASGIDPRLAEAPVDRLMESRRQRSTRGLPRTGETDISVVGYLTANTGVGEAARLTLKALHSSARKVDGLDVGLNVASSRTNRDSGPLLTDRADGRLQLLHINADQLPIVQEHLRDRLRPDAYRVAVPFWELSDFPDAWVSAFANVDEIWAPTRFIQTALATRVDKPVIHMPIALEFDAQSDFPKDFFGLPTDRFVFLFSFDFLSFCGRKNPKAVLKAFELAFGRQSSADVALVIKCVNTALAPDGLRSVLAALPPGLMVHVLDRELSRPEMLGLVAAADCVVSLHRSEGLGLLVAEAMALGTPVVATDYSATTELVSNETGYPVDYKLIPLEPDEYPHASGQVWAEPDLVHAAWQMRMAFDRAGQDGALIQRAKQHLESSYGLDAVRRHHQRRLQELGFETMAEATSPW